MYADAFKFSKQTVLPKRHTKRRNTWKIRILAIWLWNWSINSDCKYVYRIICIFCWTFVHFSASHHTIKMMNILNSFKLLSLQPWLSINRPLCQYILPVFVCIVFTTSVHHAQRAWNYRIICGRSHWSISQLFNMRIRSSLFHRICI